MPIFCTSKAWEEYGKEYAVHKELRNGCVLDTIGPQPDKGTTARDFSGRRNNGTLTGATHLPTWSNHSYRGQSFRGLTFDGADDRIYFPSINFPRFTICCWINSPTIGAGGEQRIVTKYSGSGSTTGSLAFDTGLSNNTLRCLARNSATGWDTANGTVTISANTWTHAAVIQDGTTLSVLKNGVVIGSDTTLTATELPALTQQIAVGGDPASRAFTGVIADVRIYNRALTAGELRLFTHPLAAYEVRLPEYFFVASAPASKKIPVWMRQYRQRWSA
jgi:hypothetical protein